MSEKIEQAKIKAYKRKKFNESIGIFMLMDMRLSDKWIFGEFKLGATIKRREFDKFTKFS